MASVTVPGTERGLRRLARRPSATRGVASWLTTVDHKKIGIMYGVASFVFFLVGGLEALVGGEQQLAGLLVDDVDRAVAPVLELLGIVAGLLSRLLLARLPCRHRCIRRRIADRVQIEAVMGTEFSVLGGDDGAHEVGRNRFQRHPGLRQHERQLRIEGDPGKHRVVSRGRCPRARTEWRADRGV